MNSPRYSRRELDALERVHRSVRNADEEWENTPQPPYLLLFAVAFIVLVCVLLMFALVNSWWGVYIAAIGALVVIGVRLLR